MRAALWTFVLHNVIQLSLLVLVIFITIIYINPSTVYHQCFHIMITLLHDFRYYYLFLWTFPDIPVSLIRCRCYGLQVYFWEHQWQFWQGCTFATTGIEIILGIEMDVREGHSNTSRKQGAILNTQPLRPWSPMSVTPPSVNPTYVIDDVRVICNHLEN
jgi:hypothetical protein